MDSKETPLAGLTSTTSFQRLSGVSRGVKANSGVRRAKDPASAFLSIRLTDQSKVINLFDLFLVARGKADGIFFWSLQINPVTTLNSTWTAVPNSVFESRLHATNDFIITEGTVMAIAPSMARQNIHHSFQHKITGSDELVLVLEPNTRNLPYFVALNWRE